MFNTENNGTWSGWNLFPGESPDHPDGGSVVEVYQQRFAELLRHLKVKVL